MIDTDYSLDDIPLALKEIIKDLGVVFGGKVSFSNHLDMICSYVTKLLGFVMRILYNALILTKVEYPSVV